MVCAIRVLPLDVAQGAGLALPKSASRERVFPNVGNDLAHGDPHVRLTHLRRVTIFAAAMLEVGGLVPLSTTDFPDRLSAVVYLQGCPWRCAYCNNKALQSPAPRGKLPWTVVLEFLERRMGLLDAVVFSGGEPTLQSALMSGMDEVRRRGFKVGLHTAGIYPRRLAASLRRVEWVALDVKARWEDYPRVTGRLTGGAAARESLDLLLDSGVHHEVRTTWDPALMPEERLLPHAASLARRGVRRFALQPLHEAMPTKETLSEMKMMFETFELRPC